jgi:hypothetical protein
MRQVTASFLAVATGSAKTSGPALRIDHVFDLWQPA